MLVPPGCTSLARPLHVALKVSSKMLLINSRLSTCIIIHLEQYNNNCSLSTSTIHVYIHTRIDQEIIVLKLIAASLESRDRSNNCSCINNNYLLYILGVLLCIHCTHLFHRQKKNTSISKGSCILLSLSPKDSGYLNTTTTPP